MIKIQKECVGCPGFLVCITCLNHNPNRFTTHKCPRCSSMYISHLVRSGIGITTIVKDIIVAKCRAAYGTLLKKEMTPLEMCTCENCADNSKPLTITEGEGFYT